MTEFLTQMENMRYYAGLENASKEMLISMLKKRDVEIAELEKKLNLNNGETVKHDYATGTA